MRSNNDLQSVIISPGCSSFKTVSGLCHAKLGLLMYPHIHLIHVSLSSEEDMAYAGALRVERTTLPICLECQTIGENSVVPFLAIFGVQAIMKSSCWAVNCFADAKLASPKLAKPTSSIGKGRATTEVSLKAWASRSTSSKVSTVVLVIPFL